VVVQSQEYEPGDVLERIDRFVESFEDYLSINMTEEEWETQVEVYRDTLQRRDTNLADKSGRLWGQISIGMDSQKHDNRSAVTVVLLPQVSCSLTTVQRQLVCWTLSMPPLY